MDNRFGTTSGMVIQTVMENGQEFCLAIDERGLYLTSARYLDKNLADPHRYSGSRATTKRREGPVAANIPARSAAKNACSGRKPMPTMVLNVTFGQEYHPAVA